MGVDVGFGGGGGREGHIVEGGEKDATIEGAEVEKALENLRRGRQGKT
jgi:hypothetical protein